MVTGSGETKHESPVYRAFLVRLWRDGKHAPWRASVTHVATGEVHKFANVSLAWRHINEELGRQLGEEEEVEPD